MAGKKILILQEFVRVEHVVQRTNGDVDLNYMGSKLGQKLKGKLKEIGINPRDITIEYIYNQVPEPKKVDFRTKRPISYIEPTLKQVKDRFDYLDELITREKYDMVIPTGKLGCKYLLGEVSITKLRGVPNQKEITTETASHTTWVFPMYSMEFITVKPNNEILYDADLSILKKYIDEGDEAFTPSEVSYEYVNTMERVREIFTYLKTNKPISSWDLETNTLLSDRDGAKALVISLSWEENQGVTIPIEHREHQWKPEELHELLELIKEYVADDNQLKVLQGGQYDIRFLMAVYGFKTFNKNADTKIGYYLTVSQEASKSFKLSDLAYEMTDMGGYDAPLEEWKAKYIEEYKAEHKKPPVNDIDGSNFSYEWFPLETVLTPYASGDTDCTLRIHNVLWNKYIKDNPKWVDLYINFYPRLTTTLARIEATGFMVDPEYMDLLDKEYEKEVDRLLDEIRDNPYVQDLESEHRELYEAGLEEWSKPKAERDEAVAKLRDKYKKKLKFNPNSADDKGRLFFDIIGARPPQSKDSVKESAVRKREDDLLWSDYKTDVNNMEWIAKNVPEAKELAELFLQHSKVKTLRNTFVVGMKKKISPSDGAIHGGFNSTGTETSRLSSNSPNLQNIPRSHQDVRKFDYTYPIKRLFVSRFEGGAIAQLDYSALEMRILGLRASDPSMTKSFLADEDMHVETASNAYGKPKDSITKDERQSAKAIAFGLVYGKGVNSQAEELGLSVDETQKIIDGFFASKPAVKQFIDATHAFLEQYGYVETMQGHRRILNGVWGDKTAKSDAFRQSVNTVIQGTGAYLTNLALVLIDDYLMQYNKRSRLVATVHDSIVLDMPPEEVLEVTTVSKFIMENLPIDFLFIDWEGQKLRYPIKADAEIGTTYKDVVGFDAELFKQFKSVKGYTQYYKDLSKFEDYEASGLITKEQRDQGIEMVNDQIDYYKNL